MRTLVFLAMSLGVAACGDDDPVRHLDGGVDSPIVDIDAPVMTAPVTLTITVDTQPQANIKVYFLAPDSSVIANTTTDAAGVATAVMPMGGSVTAISPYQPPPAGASFDLYTFTGVKPGDHLKLANEDGLPGTTITMTGPEDTDAATTRYKFASPCATATVTSPGSGSQPMGIVSEDRLCSTTTDFLVTSHDANDDVLHYIYLANKAVSTTLDFTAETWVAPTTKLYEVDNTDVFNNEVSIKQMLHSSKGKLTTLYPTQTSQSLPYTYSLPVPAFSQAVSAIETEGFQGGLAEHHILEWAPLSTTKYTLDAGANALADITVAPAFDPAYHTITWTEGTTGLAPDFSLAMMTGFRTATSTGWSWTIAGAHTSASLQFPTLPTDVADFTITVDDSPTLYMVATFKNPGGYDAARADVFGNGSSLMAAATGTVAGALYEAPMARTITPASWRSPRELIARASASALQTLTAKAPKRVLTGRHR